MTNVFDETGVQCIDTKNILRVNELAKDLLDIAEG